MIFTLLYVFFIKFFDCALGTAKTVFLLKNKFFISAICNSLSAALFIVVADAMANAPTDQKALIITVIFLANLVGGYIPPKIITRFEQDKLFIFNITADNFENGTIVADSFRQSEIPVSTTVAYDSEINKVLHIKAYAINKEHSKIIMACLNELPEFKYHITEGHI